MAAWEEVATTLVEDDMPVPVPLRPKATSRAVRAPRMQFQEYSSGFQGLKTPFVLPIECFPVYLQMLQEDPNCEYHDEGSGRREHIERVCKLRAQVHAFCAVRGYDFPDFTSLAVMIFFKTVLKRERHCLFSRK